MRRAVNKVGEELFPSLLLVRKADILAQSDYKRNEKLQALAAWEACFDEIVKSGQCVSLKTLAVNGRDLIEEGFAPGKQLGDILDVLLQDVLENPEHNTREYLLLKAQKTLE